MRKRTAEWMVVAVLLAVAALALGCGGWEAWSNFQGWRP